MREVLASLGSAEVERLPFKRDESLDCWIAICRKPEFDQCAKRLSELSRDVFDKELRKCASEADKLSRVGVAALFLLRRAPGRRDTDVAMRELAAADIQSEHDLYRRLLGVMSVNLHLDEDVLDRRARRHVESIRSAVFVEKFDLQKARLAHKVKSTRLVSAPAVLGNDEWSPDDSLMLLFKYVSELLAEESKAASSRRKEVRNRIVHYRPLEFEDDHSAPPRENPTAKSGAHLWNKMEKIPTNGGACHRWMSSTKGVKRLHWS